jgi:hypothetical protein
MLILTRRVGEALMVGQDVTVTVLAVKGSKVPDFSPVSAGPQRSRVSAASAVRTAWLDGDA